MGSRGRAIVITGLGLLLALGAVPSAALDRDARITKDGLGSLRVGMTLAEVRAANGGKPVDTDNQAGGGSCSSAVLGKNVFGLFTDDVLASVSVRTSRYRTRTGVHVGQSSSTVYSRYRSVKRSRHTYIPGGSYLKVTTGRRRIVFDVDASRRITLITSGRIPEVDYVEGCA